MIAAFHEEFVQYRVEGEIFRVSIQPDVTLVENPDGRMVLHGSLEKICRSFSAEHPEKGLKLILVFDPKITHLELREKDGGLEVSSPQASVAVAVKDLWNGVRRVQVAEADAKDQELWVPPPEEEQDADE